MSTVTAIDYRRTDLRKQVLENPFWITSGEVSVVEADDLAAILFSFPNAGRVMIVHEICVQITEVCAGGTAAGLIGTGTLATDGVTTGGVVTDVDQDDYLATAAITWGTLGYYYPATCDFITAKAAGTLSGPTVIVGAATTVPAICAYCTNVGTPTAGKFRVHALISEIPGK